MMHGLTLSTALLLAVACLAALIDMRSRRIPNWLSFSAFVAGLIVHGMDGRSGLADAILGCGLALLVYVPLFALQALGAGDVKLMAALGAILGPLPWLWVFFATCVAGGTLAALGAISRRNLRSTVWNTFHLFQCLTRLESPARLYPELSVRHAGSTTMPHALSIAVAACLYAVVPH